MPAFVMLTRLSSDAVKTPGKLAELEHHAIHRLQKTCGPVEWVHNFALMGGYDYLDIFIAPDLDTAFKISAGMRTLGHASVEIFPAVDWKTFKALVATLG
ncbi:MULTISPECIES: GYD domain-containing protein [Burkholderia]|uniref:GYD domain-containing protein n=1 Tax=Burkholderia TaxID=32008 RepID=UPI000863894C|nr:MULTISPECIES: GYD domain-containing protein [Burkholderia]AOL04206.1 GYD family protein [Burkholderia contaminans]TCW70046.1 GYD family protein [Burkholderia sp. SRS-25]